MVQLPDLSKFDPKRVDDFFGEIMKWTKSSPWQLERRSQVLDERIRNAELRLPDKIEVFKKLAPGPKEGRLRAVTDERRELRMERLLLSVPLEDLPSFKFALEYDGDYKDLEEYVFHDIDDRKRQNRVLSYFKQAKEQIGLKVLSDVDDTMYANLIDGRYPKKTLYPGVVEFYDSLKREPFALPAVPITTLSARPSPISGFSEEASLRSLMKFTNEKLCPSALSGALISSSLGTLQSLLRKRREELEELQKLGELEKLDILCDQVPDGQEVRIGEVKFNNFARFSAVYPEYGYVFIGDSGQADALTADLMLTEASTEGTSRVVTTFIHDLRESEDDEGAASPTFRNLRSDLLITKEASTGRGVIVFRNYIAAAVIAHMHSPTLGNLITAGKLARITRAALEQFQKVDFRDKEASEKRLREQYRHDAEEAYDLLLTETPRPSDLEGNMTEIRRILDKHFQGTDRSV